MPTNPSYAECFFTNGQCYDSKQSTGICSNNAQLSYGNPKVDVCEHATNAAVCNTNRFDCQPEVANFPNACGGDLHSLCNPPGAPPPPWQPSPLEPPPLLPAPAPPPPSSPSPTLPPLHPGASFVETIRFSVNVTSQRMRGRLLTTAEQIRDAISSSHYGSSLLNVVVEHLSGTTYKALRIPPCLTRQLIEPTA